MKYCLKCGAELNDESRFCKVCGAPQPDLNQDAMTSQLPQVTHNAQPAVTQNSLGQGVPQNALYEGNQQFNQQQFAGQQVNQQLNQQPPIYGGVTPAPKKNSNKGLIAGLIVAATVLILLVGTFLILTQKGIIDIGSNSSVASNESGKKSSSKDKKSNKSSKDSDDDEDSDDDADDADSDDDDEDTTEEATTEEEEPDTSFDGLVTALSDKTSMNLSFVSSDVTDYPNVKVYYTVEDNDGVALTLDSPNVAIKEKCADGAEVEREIVSVEPLKGNQGVSFNICADKSGSMEDSMSTMQTAMAQFVDAMDTDSGDRAELISFDTYIMYMCTYTQDKTLLKNGINNMVADGGTAFYDALYEGVLNSASQEGARCVIAFTDGEDNESYHTAPEVINYANSVNVPIFIIGTTESYMSSYEGIANDTGGKYWSINSISDMSEVLTEIYEMEKDMYCIEYISDSSVDAYSERSVSCVMSDGTYGSSESATFTPTEAVQVKEHTSRYEVIKADVSWTEANALCMQNGGHLVTITSQTEMDEVSQLCADAGIKYVWMGGYTSVYGSSSFGHWVTGEDFTYTAWYPGEPSRQDRADGVEEMYLMLWNVNDEWSWNDQRNDVISTGLSYFPGNVGYVCEYED